MRTYQLVKSLTETETAEVELLLNAGKRQNLLALFKQFKRYKQKDTLPDVKDLLQKVFKQKWTKPAELQLRNKLSRLNDILYTYLVQQEFKKQATNNEHLFNLWKVYAFRSRGLKLVYEELEEATTKALNEYMLDDALLMLRLRAMLPQNDLKKSLQYLHEWQEAERRRFFLHQSYAEASRALYFQTAQNQSQSRESVWEEYQAPDYEYDFSSLKNEWYFRVFENSRLSATAVNTDDELRYAKEAYEAMHGITTSYFMFRGMPGNLLLNIAQCYFVKCDVPQAYHYMQLHIEGQKREGLPIRPEAWVNYIVALNNLGKLTEAKAIYNANRPVIENSPYATAGIFCYCTACLFTNDSNKVSAEFQNMAIQYGHEKVVARILYTVSFMVQQEYKLAGNELRNLKRAIAGFEKNDYLDDLEKMVLLLERYNHALGKSKVQRKLLCEKLKPASKKLSKIFNGDPVQGVILKWLANLTG